MTRPVNSVGPAGSGSIDTAVPQTATSTDVVFEDGDGLQFLADANDISVDEAQVLADLLTEVGDLHVFVQTNQAATFAGMWIEHNPFRVMVAYVDDAAGLRSRISAPEVLHPVDVTYTAQHLDDTYRSIYAAREELTDGLEALLGAEFGGTIALQENVIRMRTVDTAVAAALQAQFPGDLVEVVMDTPPTTVLH